MTRSRALTSLIVCGFVGWAGPVGANAVTDWNAITVQAVLTAARPVHATLDLALVQAAVHDAVQAIDGRFKPYHVKIDGASGSPAAAVAAAAYGVLVGLYPEQKPSLDMIYDDYLTSHGLVGDPGLAVGEAAAAGMLPLQRLAPDPPPPPFLGGTDPGEWRPTDSFLIGAGPDAGLPGPPFGPPPPFAAGAAPWWGELPPFTLKRPNQFRARPPLRLAGRRYAREYKEVKDLGARLGSKRSAEQTDLGYFYADNFLALLHRAFRGIADLHVPDIGDSARLFALASLAMADSIITSWESKYHYNFWRPLTAIREGDHDGNRRTRGDPTWEPLINTPNYPDHTSGATSITAALTRTLSLFFRTDHFTFEVSSAHPRAIQKIRQYDRFSDMAEDVVNVRIYQGIHFRTADEAARKQGRAIARWAFKRFLRPVHDHDDDDHDDDHHHDRESDPHD
jgi:PAP2 superfamily